MDKLSNRKRCLKCQYYGCNVCPLMAGADTFKIDKCILEYDTIKDIKENSLDYFVFYNNPVEYLSYLGFKEKDNYPVPGQKVLTLTAGFSSSYSGKFVQVDSEDEVQIFLSDANGEYAVSKTEWWKKLFKLD